jgi:glycosyltransferase involved in cell wall biosynthesis
VIRVLLDATAIPAQRGGVGRYVDALIAHLPAAGVDLHVVGQRRDRAGFVQLLGQQRVHDLPHWAAARPARLVWEQLGLPRLARTVGADVVHSPHYTLPLLSPIPVTVTVHDATFFTDPGVHRPLKALFFRTWTRIAVRRGAAVILPSEATRREVGRVVGGVPRVARVIPHGVDGARFVRPAPARLAAVREQFGLQGDYLCFLGTLEPRKNVPALVRAWVAACADVDEPPTLVLAGSRGWDSDLDQALAQVPSRLRVVRPGFVPDDALPALLAGAVVVAYPSLGEGFGLPVLEAMACGACVLTTAGLSIPEVGGDAVEYAASPDQVDLRVALSRLLADPARRRLLAERAVVRAASFTWQACAARHASAYRAAASGSRPAPVRRPA